MLFSTIFCLSAAVVGAFAAPTSFEKRGTNCVKTFKIRVRSLENLNANTLPTSADGKFLSNLDGAVSFSNTTFVPFSLVGGLLVDLSTGNYAAVKTATAGSPHAGDIVLVNAPAAFLYGMSLVTCTSDSKTLTCNAGARTFAQVCGKYVNMDPTRNANCLDHIAFDIVNI